MSLMTMHKTMYRFIYRNKSRMIGMLLLAPYLIGVAILILYPLSQTVIHSFTDTIDGEQFVGIQNFLSMKDSRAFQSAVSNSAIFYLISLPLMVVLPLIGAVLYTQNRRLDGMFHHTVFLSILLPTAALMQFADLLFSEVGMFTESLCALFDLPIGSLYDTPHARPLLIFLFLFKYGGYNALVYYAAIRQLPEERYESAKIDGAGKLACFRYITLPALRPAFPTVLLLSVLNSYKVYREAFQIGGYYPHDSIYLIQHYIHNNFLNMNYTRLCCISVLLLCVGIGAAIICGILYRAGERANEA